MRLDVPWCPVEAQEAESLGAELHREMPEGHQLAGVLPRVVGRRTDRDDVLVDLGDDRWAVVHLTWKRTTELDPRYPITTIYGSIDALRGRLDADRVDFGDA